MSCPYLSFINQLAANMQQFRAKGWETTFQPEIQAFVLACIHPAEDTPDQLLVFLCTSDLSRALGGKQSRISLQVINNMSY